MRLGWREVACKQSTPPRTPARASRFVSRTGLRDARNCEGRTGAQRTDASRQRPPVEHKRKQNSELTRSSQTAMSGARVLQSRCGAVVTRPASRRTVTCASDRMSEMRREAHFSKVFAATRTSRFSHFVALRASRLAQVAPSFDLRRTHMLLARARRSFTSRVAVRAPARKEEVLESTPACISRAQKCLTETSSSSCHAT